MSDEQVGPCEECGAEFAGGEPHEYWCGIGRYAAGVAAERARVVALIEAELHHKLTTTAENMGLPIEIAAVLDKLLQQVR